eukprot:1516834-Rhodomonas_salina.9
MEGEIPMPFSSCLTWDSHARCQSRTWRSAGAGHRLHVCVCARICVCESVRIYVSLCLSAALCVSASQCPYPAVFDALLERGLEVVNDVREHYSHADQYLAVVPFEPVSTFVAGYQHPHPHQQQQQHQHQNNPSTNKKKQSTDQRLHDDVARELLALEDLIVLDLNLDVHRRARGKVGRDRQH